MEENSPGMGRALGRLLRLLGHWLCLGCHDISLRNGLRLMVINGGGRHQGVIILRLWSRWKIILLTSVGINEDLRLGLGMVRWNLLGLHLMRIGKFPTSHNRRGHGYGGLMRREVIPGRR